MTRPTDAPKPFRTAQEAKAGKTLPEQLRENIFKMRGHRAFLFQEAADRIDMLERGLSALSESAPQSASGTHPNGLWVVWYEDASVKPALGRANEQAKGATNHAARG